MRLFIIIFTLFSFSLNANDIKDLIGKKLILTWDNKECSFNLHSWYQLTGSCANDVHKIENIVTDNGFSYLLWEDVNRPELDGAFNEAIFYNDEGGITFASLEQIEGAEWNYSSPNFEIEKINYKKETEEINLIKKRLDFHKDNLLTLADLSSNEKKDDFLNCDKDFLHEMAIDSKNETPFLNDIKNKKLLKNSKKVYEFLETDEGQIGFEKIIETFFATGEMPEEMPEEFSKFSREDLNINIALLFSYGFGCSGMFN